MQLRGELRQPQLIDLEQAELAVDRTTAVRGGEQRRGDPPAMLAPARLCTSRTPSRSRIAAAIAAVVVLPLVAETNTLPRLKREPSTPIASGCRRISTFPGTLVAPPPRSRESAPAARANASLGPGARSRSAAGRAAADPCPHPPGRYRQREPAGRAGCRRGRAPAPRRAARSRATAARRSGRRRRTA